MQKMNIIKEVNTNSFNDLVPELFLNDIGFDKTKCGYYRKSNSIGLNCLRCMLKDIDYEFVYKERDLTHNFDGKNYRKKHSFYSIQKTI